MTCFCFLGIRSVNSNIILLEIKIIILMSYVFYAFGSADEVFQVFFQEIPRLIEVVDKK